MYWSLKRNITRFQNCLVSTHQLLSCQIHAKCSLNIKFMQTSYQFMSGPSQTTESNHFDVNSMLIWTPPNKPHFNFNSCFCQLPSNFIPSSCQHHTSYNFNHTTTRAHKEMLRVVALSCITSLSPRLKSWIHCQGYKNSLQWESWGLW